MKHFYLLPALICCLLISPYSTAQLGWVQVSSPNPSATRNMVRGISGTSSSDVWAVGSYEEVLNVTPYYIEHDLFLHWNGNSWQQFPSLNLSATLNDLYDVEALSANNVWAVGNYNDPGTTRAGLYHFDGTSWSNHPLPMITGGSFLYSIHAINPNDIWAAGGKAGSPSRPAYTIHYDGSNWSEINVPIVGNFRTYFNEIHGISGNDVWAVGYYGQNYGDFHALAMHWNGSNWTNITLPASVVTPLSEILNVKMVSANDVWASGYYLSGGAFMIHWDGNSWTEINPPIAGGPFAVVSSNNIYSFGGQIRHWDGTSWANDDMLSQLSYPSLVQAVTFANGEIWAAGRTVDASNNFYSLIYRSVNHLPQFTGGNNQHWNLAANVTSNLPSTYLRTADADVSQVINYSVITPPSHGNINGLPSSAITNNGIAIPAGISYTPQPGYSGPDQFVVRASVGPVQAQTTINLNIDISLPIILNDFNVSRQSENALLKWSTVTESNTERFEIERSSDGNNYSIIGLLPAMGNSNTKATYSFIDTKPLAGQNYYRIRLFDRDGKVFVFPVRSVEFDKPVIKLLGSFIEKETIRFELNTAGKFQVRIYDLKGRLLQATNINNDINGKIHDLPFRGFSKDMYLIRISNGLVEFREKFMNF